MKNILLYFLVICLLLPTMACSRQSEADSKVTELQFTRREYPSPDGAEPITAQCVNESQILIGVKGKHPLFGGMNFDGSGELLALPDNYGYIYAACTMEAGAAILADESAERNGELSILLYDKNNKLLREIALDEDYSGGDMNFGLMLYVDNYFVLMSNEYLIKIDENGTEIGRISKEDGLDFSSICVYNDEIIVSRGQTRNSTSQMCTLDFESFTLGESIDLIGSMILGLGVSEDGRLLINDLASNCVSYLDLASGERTEMFSWGEIGLNMPRVRQITQIEDGYVFFEPNQNAVNIVEYETVTYEKTELILATDIYTPEMNELVYRFNNKSKDYKVTVVEYGGMGKTVDNLRTEINAGKTPDIYAFEGENPLRGASGSPLYEDLLPYLDADPEYSRETLFPSLLNAFVREDGELNWMPYDFTMLTFTAPVSLVGERTSITMEEAESIAADNGLYVFDIAIDQEWLLSFICSTVINRYIDPIAGICDFENPDFIALLEKCNEHPEKRPEELEERRCVLSYYYFFWFDNYGGIKNFNGDYCFAGLPVSGEPGGVFMNNLFNLRFAISSQSEHKDGAWEFVRSILSSENQQAADNFPVVQKEFELKLEAAIAGNLAYRDDPEMKIDISQSDADKLRNLIDSTTYMVSDDAIARDIIKEEAMMYFAGDRTVEETARIIQNRLSTYVAEQQKTS